MGSKKKPKEHEELVEKETPDIKEEIQEETGEESELTKCQEELQEQKDKYLRAYADFENMKKRLEREKTNAVIFANEAFAKDLLTVLDTFENALSSFDKIEANEEAVDKIKEGMVLTYEQLLSVLKKHGVEEIACEGEFNPEFHQAVTQMDSDKHESGEIVQVLQKGYKLKDRILRASMVATCK